MTIQLDVGSPINSLRNLFTREDVVKHVKSDPLLVAEAVIALINSPCPLLSGLVAGVALTAYASKSRDKRYKPMAERVVKEIKPICEKPVIVIELIAALAILIINDSSAKITSFFIGLKIGVIAGTAVFK